MVSDELRDRIAKHKIFGKEILDYANSTIIVNLRFTSINKLAIELEKMRQTVNKEQKIRKKNSPAMFKKKTKNNSPKFFHKLEEMIEKYLKENREIEKLRLQEKNNEKSTNSSVLPKNPFLEQLTTEKYGNVLRPWYNGKYKCSSLKKFIYKYTDIADNLTPDLIRDYLISARTGKPYKDDSIYNAIDLHRPYKK